MKLRLMQALDWIDKVVIGHRWYGLCVWLSENPWWGESSPQLPPEAVDRLLDKIQKS